MNLVAWAWGVRNLAPGDVVLVTEMEHHSGIVPWQIVAELTGARVLFAPITGDGELDLDWIARTLQREPVRIMNVVHVSNALGTINPITEIARMAHDAGALVLADGSQSVPHMPVRFGELEADFLAFTGHKMLGPTGIGVLVGRPEILDSMGPFLGGGEMISDVRLDGSDWADLPWKFEAGTPPIAEAVGIGAAADYLRHVGLDAIRAHERALVAYALDALGGGRRAAALRTSGPGSPRGAHQLQPPGPAPARHRAAGRPRTGLHSCRPPLREAAHAVPRGERHGAGERVPLQRHRRHRYPGARAPRRAGVHGGLRAWPDSTISTRS